MAAADSGLSVLMESVWSLEADGEVELRVEIQPSHGWKTVWPRIGVRFDLPDGTAPVDGAEWFGLGPLESYPDSVHAARTGRFTAAIGDLSVDYARPQETGHRSALRRLALTSGNATVLRVEALPDTHGRRPGFTLSRHTPQEIAKAGHPHELPVSRTSRLFVDAAQHGLGSRACGPDVGPSSRCARSPARSGSGSRHRSRPTGRGCGLARRRPHPQYGRRRLPRPRPHPAVPVGRSAPMPTLLSVNVGMPKDVPWQGRTVYTGVWKYPVVGPAMVRRLNIDGDGQGDTAGHGGEQRAVLVYQIQSYRHWQRHFGRDDLGYGQFGENLTVDGLPDDEVCIGDRYRIGEAEFEVTQPRVTCYRVGMRFGEPELAALLVSHHRPGFYLRVVREGQVQAGDRIVRTRTGPGALSVADTDALLYLPGRDPARLRLALDVPALSPGWQGSFRELLAEADGTTTTAPPAWAGFRALRVTDVVPESTTVTSIRLRPRTAPRSRPPVRAST